MAGQWWRGGNRKEKEAGMSTKMAKSTTTGISHSPSPIRVAERGLDLRGKLHFLKRVLSSKGNGRRARGVSKQRTAKQINRNTAARENWRSRRHHHSRRKKKGYGFGTTKKPLTQRNTPPSSTQAAPKQHQQKAPLRRPCSSRARLHSPPNYDNKMQCENTQKQSRQSCAGADIYYPAADFLEGETLGAGTAGEGRLDGSGAEDAEGGEGISRMSLSLLPAAAADGAGAGGVFLCEVLGRLTFERDGRLAYTVCLCLESLEAMFRCCC